MRQKGEAGEVHWAASNSRVDASDATDDFPVKVLIEQSARPCGRNFDRLRFLGFPWGIGHGVSFRAAGERLRLHLLLWRWRQSASSADLGAQEQAERPHRQAGLEIAARAIGEERI